MINVILMQAICLNPSRKKYIFGVLSFLGLLYIFFMGMERRGDSLHSCASRKRIQLAPVGKENPTL